MPGNTDDSLPPNRQISVAARVSAPRQFGHKKRIGHKKTPVFFVFFGGDFFSRYLSGSIVDALQQLAIELNFPEKKLTPRHKGKKSLTIRFWCRQEPKFPWNYWKAKPAEQ